MRFEPMPRLSIHYSILPLSAAFVSSAEVLSHRSAIAHADHYKTEPPNQSEDKTIVEEIPVTQASASASKFGLFDGFSVGIGEPLLVLIMAAPFILRRLKRQSKS